MTEEIIIGLLGVYRRIYLQQFSAISGSYSMLDQVSEGRNKSETLMETIDKLNNSGKGKERKGKERKGLVCRAGNRKNLGYEAGDDFSHLHSSIFRLANGEATLLRQATKERNSLC
jgi:hypothetical protein